MKRITCLIAICAGLGMTAVAQQRPLSTQFMTNPFALNPALAGTHNYFQVVSNNRFQWMGFTDAPITNSLSVFGPLVKFPMGWGGTISYDVSGPVSIGTVHGSYAYNYSLNEEMKISMGLNVGIAQYKIDLTRVNMEDPDQVMDGKESYYLPDANLGFYFYTSTYHVGFVVTNLLNNRIKIGADPTGDARQKSHFFLTGGYKYYINREWAIEPSAILKKVWPAPFQLDLNTRVWYRNMLWGGLSYRSQEAVSIMVGYLWDRKISIGYSYDLVLNPLMSYNFGSHELTLGYRFNDIKD